MSLNTISDGAIPDTIRAFEQWICWREDDRNGKPTKVPIKPYRTSGTPLASATDSDTWREFETALTYHRDSNARTDGVGFVFDSESPIIGIDLDNCRDPDSKEVEPWAAEIIDRINSYTEVSPSGTGIHILVEGVLPAGRNRRGDVEIYDQDRFFTVTGAHLAETPTDVTYRQDAVRAVHHEFVQTAGENEAATLTETTAHAISKSTGGGEDDDTPTQPVGPNSGLRRKFGRDPPAVDEPALEAALHGLSPGEIPDPVPRTIDEVAGPGVELSDSELLRRAMGSKSGDTIQKLLDGDSSLWSGRDSRYASQSEADMGLCFYLAFWTGGDPERIDDLFRESGLYREKWDRRHYGNGATYGEVTIARALLKIDDYYSTPDEDTEPSGSGSSQSLTEPDVNPPPADTTHAQAIEDAKRLASKVQHQQRELDVQRERIEELETRLRWYRRLVGVPSDHHITGREGSFSDTPHETDLPDSISNSSLPREPDPPAGDETNKGPRQESEPAGVGPEADEETTHSRGVIDRLRRWFS